MEDYKKKSIEIPFGAKDSELGGFEYTIADGYEAEIKNGKVIVKKVESEDEKIRKWLIDYLDNKILNSTIIDEKKACKDAIAWLEKKGEPIDKIVKRATTERQRVILTETNGNANIDWDTRSLQDVKLLLEYGLDYIKKLEKQDQQKPVEVKPKFKVGDWIVEPREDEPDYLWHIDGIKDDVYWYDAVHGGVKIAHADKNYHLWTIQDAKDGDVLANEYGAIFINAGSSKGGGTLDFYCYLSVQNKFCIEENKTGSWFYKDEIKPATKEQRGILFSKMHEAGYEWNAEKKELKKIEQKPVNKETDYDNISDVLLNKECWRKYEDKQKSEWSEEDSKWAEEIRIALRFYSKDKLFVERLTNWFDNHIKPKQGWSEEDIVAIDCAVEVLSKDLPSLAASIERLKSLRPQINVTDEELALAKKDAYNDALDKIEYHSGEPTFDDGWSAAIRFLRKKNAIFQKQWKPSEEQMNALLWVIENANKSVDINISLNSLYEQLKAL